MAYFLPPFDKCPVSFLRSLLSGEKKVNILNHYRKNRLSRMRKQSMCGVQKYKELSTRIIWAFVKEIPELMIFFPDYTSKQCPDKDYLFSVLGAVREDQLKELIQETRKKKSVYEEPDINEFIEITEEMKKEIDEVFTQKSRN